MKKNIRILITGSSGYIGSCLSESLKKKFIVFGIDKNKNSITKQKKFFRINLLNYKKSYSIIKKIKPNIVIHLAAQSTIDNIHDKKSYLKNNIEVTKKIIKICEKLNINKIIFNFSRVSLIINIIKFPSCPPHLFFLNRFNTQSPKHFKGCECLGRLFCCH